jgi:hypothetical protein
MIKPGFIKGKIFNSMGKELKLSHHNNNYSLLSTTEWGKARKNFYVHRLVAEIFIPNPNNYPNVNHIDLNRKNNSKDNLEWCTQLQNINHSVNLGSYEKKPIIKKVLQFSKTGECIKEWNRAKEISSFFNCTEELIQQACSQKHKYPLTAKGYLWIYKEDFENNNTLKFDNYLNKNKNV